MQSEQQLPDSVLQERIGASLVYKRDFAFLACGPYSGEFLLYDAKLLLHGLQSHAESESSLRPARRQTQGSKLLLQPFPGFGFEDLFSFLRPLDKDKMRPARH